MCGNQQLYRCADLCNWHAGYLEETADTELIEQQEMDNADITAVMLEEAVPMSGSVDIDINVDVKIRVITNTVYMRKGSKVTFTLYADNSDNKFGVGLLDSKIKRFL